MLLNIFSAYENRYNPFYYYYTQQQRDQAMSNMMNPVKQSSQASANQVMVLFRLFTLVNIVCGCKSIKNETQDL